MTQNYGRGRTAVFATSGTWRWQMSQPLEDKTHEMFWQQMLRWLVAGTHGPVISSVPKSVFADEQRIPIRVDARDKNYLPLTDGRVEATVIGPENTSDEIELRPDPADARHLHGRICRRQAGIVCRGNDRVRRGDEEVGRDVITFRREDGVAENFRTEQNRELLEKLASETGGKYYKSGSRPASIPAEISYSEAGISREGNTRSLEYADLLHWRVCFCDRPNGCCAGNGALYEDLAALALLRRSASASATTTLRRRRRPRRRAGLRAALRHLGEGSRTRR